MPIRDKSNPALREMAGETKGKKHINMPARYIQPEYLPVSFGLLNLSDTLFNFTAVE